MRQNIDSSSNIKINKSNSNASSMTDVNSLTPKPSRKTMNEEDSNLTDIATELQSHTSRRESRKLSKMNTHNSEGSSSGHHSKSKSKSSKIKEHVATDDN